MITVIIFIMAGIAAAFGGRQYARVSTIKAKGCYQCHACLYWYGTMDTFFEGIKLGPSVYVCKTCHDEITKEIPGEESKKLLEN